MENFQDEAYANLVRPESSHGGETHKSPSSISKQTAMSPRRYRLSLSPLDSLQAEFLRYNDTDQRESLGLSQSASQRSIVSLVLITNLPRAPRTKTYTLGSYNPRYSLYCTN